VNAVKRNHIHGSLVPAVSRGRSVGHDSRLQEEQPPIQSKRLVACWAGFPQDGLH
jgi:hypothetical protein